MKRICFLIALSIMLFVLSCNAGNAERNTKVSLSKISEEEFVQNSNNTLNRFSHNQEKEEPSTIKLPIKYGEAVVFNDNLGEPYDEDEVYFHKLDCNTTDNYLIKMSGYESSNFLLVNRDNGNIDTLPAYPHFSKNNNIIFTANHNQYETYVDLIPPTEDLYIYTYENDQLKKVFLKACNFFDDTYLQDFYWHDENTVHLKFINMSNREETKFIALKIPEKI